MKKATWSAGRQVLSCKANPHRQSIRLGLIGLCLALGTTFGPDVFNPIIAWQALIIIIFFIVPGCVLVGQYLWLRFRRLTIYEDGITIGFWPLFHQFRWSDFTALSTRRYRERDIGINLYINHRRILTVNRNYQHAELITKLVAVRTAEALVNRYLEVFKTRGEIEIGRLQLSTTGVHYRTRHLAWDALYSWRFEGDFLSFYQYGAILLMSINLYNVKNAYVLPWVLEAVYLHWKSFVDVSEPVRVLPDAS